MTAAPRAVTVEVDVLEVDARVAGAEPDRFAALIGARLEALIATRGLPASAVRPRDAEPIGDDAEVLADRVAERVWGHLAIALEPGR
jgi:hypothetical protein